MSDTPSALHARAQALKAAGQLHEAADVYRRLTGLAPQDRVAWHNLGSTVGDLGRHSEAEAACRRARALGLDAAETWLVEARALMGLGRLDAAVETFVKGLGRRPTDPALHRDLAQLVWMRTGDRAKALARFEDAVRRHPKDLALRLTLSRVLAQIGDVEAALTLADQVARAAPRNPVALTSASFAAITARRWETALGYARRAAEAAPKDRGALLALGQARLAVGDAAGAERTAADLQTVLPLDQFVIALRATAWRALGDPRYYDLYDYTRVVGRFPLDTPQGWGSLEAYVADASAALEARHAFAAHPFEQSVKGASSQITHVELMDEPALKAWPEAVAGPIRRHARHLGPGFNGATADDSIRSDVALRRALRTWSVKLTRAGRHTDHVHPAGWLSSACHLTTDGAVAQGPHGWLRFGQPGAHYPEPLEAEYWVRPQPGVIVLFPSYLWHGVAPVAADAARITVAMDVARAPSAT